MRLVRPLVAAFAVGSVLLASGCGGSSDPLKGKSADQILSLAKSTLDNSAGVRIAGTMTDEQGTSTYDIVGGKTGTMSGTVTASGETITLLKTADTVYFKGEAKAWAAVFGLEDDEAQELGGKWGKAAASDYVGQADSGPLGIKTLGDLLAAMGPVEGVTLQSGTTKIDGKKALAISGKDAAGDAVILYVANTKDATPLRIAPGAGSSDKGQVVFSDWGKTPEINAPSDAIDLETLGSSSDEGN